MSMKISLLRSPIENAEVASYPANLMRKLAQRHSFQLFCQCLRRLINTGRLTRTPRIVCCPLLCFPKANIEDLLALFIAFPGVEQIQCVWARVLTFNRVSREVACILIYLCSWIVDEFTAWQMKAPMTNLYSISSLKCSFITASM